MHYAYFLCYIFISFYYQQGIVTYTEFQHLEGSRFWQFIVNIVFYRVTLFLILILKLFYALLLTETNMTPIDTFNYYTLMYCIFSTDPFKYYRLNLIKLLLYIEYVKLSIKDWQNFDYLKKSFLKVKVFPINVIIYVAWHVHF